MMEWFMTTGIRIAIIIVVALILFLIFRFVIPALVKRFISRGMTGEAEIEINKRTDTLSSILVSVTGIVIALLAILTV